MKNNCQFLSTSGLSSVYVRDGIYLVAEYFSSFNKLSLACGGLKVFLLLQYFISCASTESPVIQYSFIRTYSQLASSCISNLLWFSYDLEIQINV